jgi:hypothetical protein
MRLGGNSPFYSEGASWFNSRQSRTHAHTHTHTHTHKITHTITHNHTQSHTHTHTPTHTHTHTHTQIMDPSLQFNLHVVPVPDVFRPHFLPDDDETAPELAASSGEDSSGEDDHAVLPLFAEGAVLNTLPSCTINQDGESLLLIDGHHRVAALNRMARTEGETAPRTSRCGSCTIA